MLKNNLSKIMGEQRIKIYELEKLSGISRSTITRLYYGKTHTISFNTLEGLCKALNCKTSDILEYLP
ncbi:MAG: helix-turn-helix transcriptional regulator [Candidatus Gastranaerophilaceae bacterium]